MILPLGQIHTSMNKYNNIRSNGFASKLESAVFNMLSLLQKAKEIKDLRCQDPVELTCAKIRCKIDFSYTDVKTKQTVYVEAKGVVTERWRIIAKLWPWYGPGELLIYGGHYSNPSLIDHIKLK
jgi:hypothetical protein